MFQYRVLTIWVYYTYISTYIHKTENKRCTNIVLLSIIIEHVTEYGMKFIWNNALRLIGSDPMLIPIPISMTKPNLITKSHSQNAFSYMRETNLLYFHHFTLANTISLHSNTCVLKLLLIQRIQYTYNMLRGFVCTFIYAESPIKLQSKSFDVKLSIVCMSTAHKSNQIVRLERYN